MDHELNYAIYQKYFATAKKMGLFWTAYDADSREIQSDDEIEIENHLEANWERFEDLKKILSLELSFWVFRHLNGLWGEVLDALKPLIVTQHRQYTEKYNQIPKTNIDDIHTDWTKIY